MNLLNKYWKEHLERYNTGIGNYVIVKGELYSVKCDDIPERFKYYSGKMFYIRNLATDRIVRTTNLEYIGEIPQSAHLKDTHEFIYETMLKKECPIHIFINGEFITKAFSKVKAKKVSTDGQPDDCYVREAI